MAGVVGMTLTPLASKLLARIADTRTIPSYGSPEWDALPDQDPRRAAAVIVAAECWRDHCSPAQVALDLLEDLYRTDAEVRRRVRDSSWDVWTTRDWPCYPSRKAPNRATVQARRGEAA
jgi:hypothetical protein